MDAKQQHPKYLRMSRIVAFFSATVAVLVIAAAPTYTEGTSYEGFSEPVREIQVAAGESGRVESVMVKRGDVVEKNGVIVKLNSRILQAARKIAVSKAQATAKLDALKVEKEIKEDRHSKLASLLSNGAGSHEEVKRAEADAAVAGFNVQAAIEQRETNQLELDEIEERIEQRVVRSPIAGVVVDLNRDEGEYVSLNEPQVATVAQLDQLRVTFFLPTSIALNHQVGQSVEIRFANDVEQENPKVVATVEHIGAVTQADSGRVRFDVLVNNQDRKFRSGIRCVFSPN